MKIKKGDQLLFGIQKDPLAVVLHSRGECMSFSLPVDLARQIALALLNNPEVGQGFDELAEAQVLNRIQARQRTLVN